MPPPPAFVERADAPALLAVAGPAWPADAERPLPPAAMVLFNAKGGGLHLGPLGDVPGIAVLNPPGEKRWAVPARGLAGLLAQNMPRGNASGWSIVAVDDASLASAEALAPQINPLVPPAGPIPGRPASGQIDPGVVGETPSGPAAGLPVPQGAGEVPPGGPAAGRAMAQLGDAALAPRRLRAGLGPGDPVARRLPPPSASECD